MIPQTPPWNPRGMGDPEKWGMPLRSKLCYLLGFAQGLVSEAACEHPDIGRSSDSEKAKGRALTEWTRMKDAAYAIIDNLKFRTLIFDTGTEAWELCRMARFGKLAQVMPQHYTEVNSEFRALVKAAYERKDLNVFLPGFSDRLDDIFNVIGNIRHTQKRDSCSNS